VKPLNYLYETIYVAGAGERGRGVFAGSAIKINTIIEISPVIVMSKKDRLLLDQTLLHDYIFEWGENRDQCCMALGYVPIYNHSTRSNCEYEMNFRKQTILVRTIRAVAAGEELFINYHGDWNSEKPVWFEAK
jgi:SET domain-containing protein